MAMNAATPVDNGHVLKNWEVDGCISRRDESDS